MSYPVKQKNPEPWFKRAIRRTKHKILRVRQCRCGETRETVEIHGRRKPTPQSTPDRCPACFIGPGRIQSMNYADNKPTTFKATEGIPPGSTYRKRRFTYFGTTWGTFELLTSGFPMRDITRCHCGLRMKIRS
jgi:hypothetical protein